MEKKTSEDYGKSYYLDNDPNYIPTGESPVAAKKKSNAKKPMLKEYEITISNKKTGLVYDTLDLEAIMIEEAENNKKYGITTDDSSFIEAVSETVRAYLEDISKEVA